MAFEVFTPARASSAAEERAAKDALRARNLAETTKELLITKDEVEMEFDQTMKRQQQEAEGWFQVEMERKTKLLKEVEQLEERREKALMPLLIKSEDIHSVEEALSARKLELDAQEVEIEEHSRLVMLKLDELSSKEQDYDERNKRLKRQETAGETQRNQITHELKQLNVQIEEFQKKSEERETDFAYRQSELDALENLYKERELGFARREEEIEASRRLLDDGRLLLEKGFAELRKNKL